MKKMIMLVSLAIAVITANAQDSYIVKTNNVRNTGASTASQVQDASQDEEPEATDFVGQYFKYRSLCDWVEGMKFMVMPEKYDMIVNTFTDAETGKEVSSNRLRQKIMIYKNHTSEMDGSDRIHFLCQDENKYYYYRIPSGSFDNYCYGKLGVPTLAYIGDVDVAREKLKDAVLYTKTDIYYIDTERDGNGCEQVRVEKNKQVKVKAIGVGTRSFPVKIIVEDEKGNQFFQNVAMSKTNSGMRDDEFGMDNVRHTFYGSFQLADENIAASEGYSKYIGQDVHTRYATKMENINGKTVNILRLSSFVIQKIEAQSNTNYVKMTLKSHRTGEIFTKQVTFVNENVAGDIDGQKEDYYGYLFKPGRADFKGVSEKHRELIHQGRIAKGFKKNEVRMALGEPSNTVDYDNDGSEEWVYNYDGQPKRVIIFNRRGVVTGTRRF